MDQYSIIQQVKKKKELSGIDDSIIMESLNEIIRKEKFASNLTEKEQKLLVKTIRARLRMHSGRFKVSSAESLNLIKKGDIEAVLETHSSTKERIDFYPELKELIKELKVNSILDLGCGLNPIALAERGITYYASDIQNDDLLIVRAYFEREHIQGKTFVYDLRKIDDSLPSADLVLLFKVLDIIESKGHKLAEKIVKSLHCKNILISFPTKTLSGKPMNHPQRGWIERMLARLGYPYKMIKSKNEIFYLVNKS